jgi:hypothetical protein
MKNDPYPGLIIGALSVPIFIAILSPIFLKNDKINHGKSLIPGEIEYKFQDTLEFVNKDTEETVKRLDNVEFRVLDKNRYMYVVKTPDLPSPEALIMNDFPPNTYLRFYQTPVDVEK